MTERLHFHTLEKEMATHSSVLAWRIPGTGEPGGLPSMGSQSRTRLNDLAVAAAAAASTPTLFFRSISAILSDSEGCLRFLCRVETFLFDAGPRPFCCCALCFWCHIHDIMVKTSVLNCFCYVFC